MTTINPNNLDLDSINSPYFEERAREALENMPMTEEVERRLIDMYREANNRATVALMNILDRVQTERATITDLYKYRRLTRFRDECRRIETDLRLKQVNLIRESSEACYVEGRNLARVSFFRPNKAVVKKLVERPWIGNEFSMRVWNNTTNLVIQLEDKLKHGIITGKPVPVIARELSESLNSSYRRAKVLVRTESMHFLNEGAKDRIREMGGQQVQILTVGERACSKCRNAETITYDIEEAPIMPLHPNCRCCIIPVVDDD